LRAGRADATLELTLSRPEKRNALSADLVEALLSHVEAAYRDGTRLLVLRGEGHNFCAGFDLSGYEAQSQGDLVLRFIRIEQLLQALRHAPFDTLALAHGRNFGAGVDLVSACARRVCAPDAAFRMPGLRFGLVLGTRLFAERVGLQRARVTLQSAVTFTASEAFHWGFATALAAQDRWPDVVAEAAAASSILAPAIAARLFRVTTPDHCDSDLAELVRSAAMPGLKARIARYLADRSAQ
jgi:enoyl-CoA hydratase/carnithine racemase